MRLSLSLQMDVLKAKAGHILNTFKIYPRRDVLFFEDILAQYVRECEKAGYGKEIGEISKKWCALETKLIPHYLRTAVPEFIVDEVIKNVWVNLGLVDALTIKHSRNRYIFKTKKEFITRIISNNIFMREGFVGAVAGLYNHDAVCREYSQTKECCDYEIELLDPPFDISIKPADLYVRLNSVPEKEGVSLKKALMSGFFQLDGNRLTFRGKSMICFENSGYHLIGHSGILLDSLSSITASFFSGLVEKDASRNNKLSMLSSILQVCGWGNSTIETNESGRIVFYIKHPPYGMQTEPDNWDFLAYFILGYLRTINKKTLLEEIKPKEGSLLLRYSGV